MAYDLGDNAASVAGGALGSALAGATVGSIVPGAGTVVGFAAGMVGGMVGTAVAAEAYATAVEEGSKSADVLATSLKHSAVSTLDLAKECVPDQVGNITAAINDFALTNNLPFRI